MTKQTTSTSYNSDTRPVAAVARTVAVLLLVGVSVVAAGPAWGAGMAADQLDLRAIDPSQLVLGSVRNLVLDLGLPEDDYEGEQLDRLNIVNLGNARHVNEITRMQGWADDGDGTYNPSADTLLGEFTFTGGRWELTGLTQVVPQTRLRIYVTVDIAEAADPGRTIQLGLPSLPDVGIGLVSGQGGPVDHAVVNPFAQAVSDTDRIIVSSGLIVPGTVGPGHTDVPLLHLVALNTYAEDRTLVTLTVSNGTDGPGAATVAERDGELDQLTLRADGNGDGLLEDLASDPVIATGHFDGGAVTFAGLTWNLAAATANHLFLTGDVSTTGAADGEVLAAFVAGGIDLGFATATSVAASWPLDSGARWTVDGMVAAQIGNLPVPAVTLAAGEGPALVMDLSVPANGYAADVLAGLRFVNLGTATASDLADLRLWRDGGDGIFSAGGGDDVELGPCVWVTDAWHSPVLDVAMPPGGLRIFAAVTVAAFPTDAATVRLAVPVGGISVTSDNDGPRDQSIESPNPTLLSTAPLLADVNILETASTVGQTVTVRMRVRNVDAEDLLGVAPEALVPTGDGVLAMAGGPVPASLDLAAGAVDSFSWTYTATAVGRVSLTGGAQGTGAIGGQVRASLPAASGEHRIFDSVSNLHLFAVPNMPFTIVRGQTDVVPLSLTFVNPGGEDHADVLVKTLRIRLKDDTGAGIVPEDLLSRVVVSEGGITYLDRTITETSGDEIALELSQPVSVTSLEPVTLGLRLDIQATTGVPAFMVEIAGDTWISATDAVSNLPIPIALQDGTFPIESGLGTLLVEATGLQIAAAATGRQQVGFGQRDVTLLAIELLNPGISSYGSDVRVGSLAFSLTDTLGVPLAMPSRVLDRLVVTSPLQTLLDISVSGHDSTIIVLDLSSPLAVPVDTPVELALAVDIAAAAVAGAVQARLAAPATIVAIDGNSGAPVPVTYESDPVTGGTIDVQQTATLFLAAGDPLLPHDLVVGARAVPSIDIALRHPGEPLVAAITVESLQVRCYNGDRELTTPAGVIDRLTILRDGAPIGVISNPTGDGDLAIPLTGVELQPGQTIALTLSLDLEVDAEAGSLELLVPGAGLLARDANLAVAVPVQPEIGEEFPLTSGVARLLESADEVLVGFSSLMPAVLVGTSAEVPVARVSLRSPNQEDTGAIDLSTVTVRAADRQLATLPVGGAVEEILLYAGNQVWATSGTLAAEDRLGVLEPAAATVLEPGVTLDLEMRVRLRSSPTVSNVRLGIDENDLLVAQPHDAPVMVHVGPEDGQRFPYWTEAGNFTGASLADSYSNFPNPFHTGRESTTFVFALERPATVSLKLLTAHTRPVKAVIDSEHRPAGLYQQDTWDGRNGRGVAVQNGVYIAELVAVYADGSQDRYLRKVAVVR